MRFSFDFSVAFFVDVVLFVLGHYYSVKNSILRLQLALYLTQLKHSNCMLLSLSSESFVDY